MNHLSLLMKSMKRALPLLVSILILTSLLGGGIPAEPSNGEVEYLIITADHLVDSLKPLAEWKTAKGLQTYIASLSWIEENYDGRDKAERIRNFIKYAYTE